jgi:hypothetical protein
MGRNDLRWGDELRVLFGELVLGPIGVSPREDSSWSSQYAS